MNASDLMQLRFGQIHGAMGGGLIKGMSDDQVRTRPHGLNSIIWLMWHVARIEDVAVNRFVSDREQVLVSGQWNQAMEIDRVDCGPGMTAEEVATLSDNISIEGACGYMAAVAERSLQVIRTLSARQLDVIVPAARVQQVITDEKVLVPAGQSVGDFWSQGMSRGWFLMQTTQLHPYGHMFDAMVVQGLVSGN